MSDSDGSPVPLKRRRFDDDYDDTPTQTPKHRLKRPLKVIRSSSQHEDYHRSDSDVPLPAARSKPKPKRARRTTDSASEAPSKGGDTALQELRRKNAANKTAAADTKRAVADGKRAAAAVKRREPKPKKPKHHIIVHNKSIEELEDTVATQLPDDGLSSSPWRQRGAIIQRPAPREEWVDPAEDEEEEADQQLARVPSSPPTPPVTQDEGMMPTQLGQETQSQRADHTGVGWASRSPSRARSRPTTGDDSESDDEAAFCTFVSRSQRALRASPSKGNARLPARNELGWERESDRGGSKKVSRPVRECETDEEIELARSRRTGPFDDSDSMDEALMDWNAKVPKEYEDQQTLSASSSYAQENQTRISALRQAPTEVALPPLPALKNASEFDVDLELANLPSDAFDLDDELANLPSDAFEDEDDEFAQPRRRQGDAITLSSQSSGVPKRNGLIAPQKNLQQRTLFGAVANAGLAQIQATQGRQLNFLIDLPPEPPTHHKLNDDALSTWIYPTNLGTVRDYQYNITGKSLFNNTLVALPTGLGKTFIAATIMLNWYRWTKDAQIFFVAPTKPLVAQQVEACFGIAGIPHSDTALLTGTVLPPMRTQQYANKRVFFMTPQTILNDLKTGIADPKRIVLLVVDEAHRATGAYAYVELVKFIRRFNQSFRVLALTATPGASVEAVQQVMDGLDIAKVEIRHENSIDIRDYVYLRQTDILTFDYSEELELIMDLCSDAIRPVLSNLNQFNAYWSKDPMSLTAFGMNQARQKWMNTAGKTASFAIKGMLNRIFSVLASLAHNISLLKFHGIGPFYHNMVTFRSSHGGGEKGSKYEKMIIDSEPFKKMMSKMQFWINNDTFIGHPKLEELQNTVVTHFLNAGKDSPTRIMIFTAFRDSAEEIVRILRRNTPEVRPHVFVGQQASKGSEGMDQKTQLDIIEKFKAGTFNVLVATSIGEEGLDIGQVDLIVCYDSSSSPIRMLQRMGRTGRKRAGRIILLLMKGKEESAFASAKDAYEKIQGMIEDGRRFKFHDDRSPRILPREIKPAADMRHVEIPPENSQAGLPEPKRGRGKASKRPPKKYHMPDNVQLGFGRVSTIGADGEVVMLELAGPRPKGKGNAAASRKAPTLAETLEPVPLLEEVLLTSQQTRDLDRKYRSVHDGGELNGIEICAPAVTLHPEAQRQLRPTKLVGHGQASRSFVATVTRMHNIDGDTVRAWKAGAARIDLDKLCGSIHLPESASPPQPAAAPPGKRKAAAAAPAKSRATAKTKAPAKVPAKAKAPPKPRGRPPKKAGIAAGRATTPAHRSNGYGSDAMEGASSSPVMTSPGMGLPTQGEELGSEDTEGDDGSDGEMDSELADWIVGSDEDVEVEPSSAPTFASSFGRARAREKPDLPGLDGLFSSSSEDELNAEENSETGQRPQKRRRRVVEEDSDDSSE